MANITKLAETQYYLIGVSAPLSRLPSSEDVRNTLSSLSNMGEDEFKVTVEMLGAHKGSRMFTALISTYAGGTPDVSDIKRVMLGESAEDPDSLYSVRVTSGDGRTNAKGKGHHVEEETLP